jgi:hypothetical protein
MQWRIAPAAWLELQPHTALNLARGQATAGTVPSEPLDGGPPVSGAPRLRVGISVPLEALRPHPSAPSDVPPPPGVAYIP